NRRRLPPLRHIRFALIASEVRLLKCTGPLREGEHGAAARAVDASSPVGAAADIDHELPENLWTISRIWNFSEDLKARIRASVAPEILDENDTSGRLKESCTSEPGTRMGPKTIRGHPPHARHPSRP